ncbi:MAG: GC-type dockerin domain-anchored protein [Phycisphaerales bacterium]
MKNSVRFSAVSALVLASGALAQPMVFKPGLTILPFAGSAAGQQPIACPKFGVIDAPFGAHMGMMFISELCGNDILMILPNGQQMPYSMIAGPFPTGAFGLDIDGPIANAFMPGGMGLPPTMGLFGGPAIASVAEQGGAPIIRVMPGGPWVPWAPSPGAPGAAQLQLDRTPGFQYGGMMYISDWGKDGTDCIFRVNPAGGAAIFCPLAGLDPRYFTFDVSGGATGYGPNLLWVSSYATGQVFAVSPLGVMMPPIAVLQPDLEGLAFGPGDAYFGPWLYACNLTRGTIDFIMPNAGPVVPFAAGLPGAAYPMFVSVGPYAKFGNPTLYVADGVGSVWMILHCPGDYNNDSFVNGDDYDAFASDFEAGNHAADFNNDGFVNGDDYDAFAEHFESGC